MLVWQSAALERAEGIFPFCSLEQGLPKLGQGRLAVHHGGASTLQLRYTQREAEDFGDFSLTYSANIKFASVEA